MGKAGKRGIRCRSFGCVETFDLEVLQQAR